MSNQKIRYSLGFLGGLLAMGKASAEAAYRGVRVDQSEVQLSPFSYREPAPDADALRSARKVAAKARKRANKRRFGPKK